MGLFDLGDLDAPASPTRLRLHDLVPARHFDLAGVPLDQIVDGKGPTERFYDVFDPVFGQLLADVAGLELIYDVNVTDERFVDLVMANFGFVPAVALSLPKKRRLAKVILRAYRFKGTALGIEGVIQQFIGKDAKVFAFTAGWILDQSLLGFDTFLNPGPTSAAGFYTFDVEIFGVLSSEERQIVLQLIELMKPAHSHFANLIESGTSAFEEAARILLNRASLYLANHANDDGGWDSLEDDGDGATVSAAADIGYEGLGLYASWLYTELASVAAAISAAGELIVTVPYAFASLRPREGDVSFLTAANVLGVAGAAAQRTAALDALEQWMRAMGALNDYAASSLALAATTAPERATQTSDRMAAFLWLALTQSYGLGEGNYRFCRYVGDYLTIGETAFAAELVATLFYRNAATDFASALGSATVKATAAIGSALAAFSATLGGLYEGRIAEAEAVLAGRLDGPTGLYLDWMAGSGTIDEQGAVLDLLMARGRYDAAKALMTAIEARQRTDGTFDDPIAPATSLLRPLGALLESMARALATIQDNGL